jgi:hypothetical protein
VIQRGMSISNKTGAKGLEQVLPQGVIGGHYALRGHRMDCSARGSCHQNLADQPKTTTYNDMSLWHQIAPFPARWHFKTEISYVEYFNKTKIHQAIHVNKGITHCFMNKEYACMYRRTPSSVFLEHNQ